MRAPTSFKTLVRHGKQTKANQDLDHFAHDRPNDESKEFVEDGHRLACARIVDGGCLLAGKECTVVGDVVA